jgi:starvation-inducible DNA-binding protein
VQNSRPPEPALLRTLLDVQDQDRLVGKNAPQRDRHSQNVKGPHFIALHELFDKISDAVLEHIDEIAERISSLGGTAEGTVAVASKRSKLKNYPLSITAGRDHLFYLSTQVSVLGKAVRAAIDDTANLGDADTADLFTGISRELDKYLWFLEAHLQDKA